MFFLVNSFDVDETNILSDHCVVSFSLDTSANIREAVRDEDLDLQYIYRWDNNKKQEYLDALNSHTVSGGIFSIKNQLNDVTNENELNENVNAFYNLFSSVCDPLFKKKIVKNDITNTEDTKHQKWFDECCHAKRKAFYNLLNVYRND